jgi:hypothetical protein
MCACVYKLGCACVYAWGVFVCDACLSVYDVPMPVGQYGCLHACVYIPVLTMFWWFSFM